MRPSAASPERAFQIEYHHLRLALRDHLPPDLATAVLDRTVALAAAPARGLLAPDLLAHLAASATPWRALCDTFAHLGRPDPRLAASPLPDDLARRLVALRAHDFTRDITLDVLGRLFEQALDDPGADRRRGAPRKREGAYYTPPALARLIAARTLAPVLQATRTNPTGRPLDLLDPACGAGVFLRAALDLLRPALPPGASLLPRLHGVDLRPEAAERARICLWLAAAEPGTTLADLDRTIRSGDSLTLDLPLVDIVLGNPPYVRHEELAALKPTLARHYPDVFHGGADLSVYFFALALRLLRPGGRLGLLGSSSWLRAAYAAPLRRLLRERATVHAILDLGDGRVFADAPDVYPAILIASRDPPPPDHHAEAAVLSRGADLDVLAALAFPLTIADQPDDAWQLLPPAERRLLHKLRSRHPTLADRADLHCGLKTGLDDAFHLTPAQRDRLVAADPTCAALLRPFLRGEDLRPYASGPPARHLVFLPSGWTRQHFGTGLSDQAAWRALAERHPGLAAHLAPFAARAAARDDRGDHWWELRPCHYAADLARPKLVWPELAGRPRFSLDRTGACLNNKAFFAATDDPWLLPLLASRPLWYLVAHTCLGLGERGGLVRYQLFARSIARLPIPEPDAPGRAALGDLARDLTAHAAARLALDRDVRDRLAVLPARLLRAWPTADLPALLTHAAPPARDPLAAWLTLQRAEHARHTAALARLEAAADAIACDLFDLTSAERDLVAARTRYLYGAQ